MDTQNVIKKLAKLVQLDIDAVHAYEQALKNIDDTPIFNQIKNFQNDHLRHVDELNIEITKLGGQPLEFTKDFKGYLIEGFTSLRSITGTEGALKAMKMNEILTNKTYEYATNDADYSSDIKELLEKNYADEQRHLQYIENAINTEAWKK